jgi:hypothetical protein
LHVEHPRCSTITPPVYTQCLLELQASCSDAPTNRSSSRPKATSLLAGFEPIYTSLRSRLSAGVQLPFQPRTPRHMLKPIDGSFLGLGARALDHPILDHRASSSSYRAAIQPNDAHSSLGSALRASGTRGWLRTCWIDSRRSVTRVHGDTALSSASHAPSEVHFHARSPSLPCLPVASLSPRRFLVSPSLPLSLTAPPLPATAAVTPCILTIVGPRDIERTLI